jgi:hypothetical protein
MQSRACRAEQLLFSDVGFCGEPMTAEGDLQWRRQRRDLRRHALLLLRSSVLTVLHALQAAVADQNVSETVYMAEALYLRYDIPFIMPHVRQALAARNYNLSAINNTHVLFTVRSPDQSGLSTRHELSWH